MRAYTQTMFSAQPATNRIALVRTRLDLPRFGFRAECIGLLRIDPTNSLQLSRDSVSCDSSVWSVTVSLTADTWETYSADMLVHTVEEKSIQQYFLRVQPRRFAASPLRGPLISAISSATLWSRQLKGMETSQSVLSPKSWTSRARTCGRQPENWLVGDLSLWADLGTSACG